MAQPGILLINTGSPDSPRKPDVRRYLKEFLMDERVLDVPYALRFAVVHGAILPFRPAKSAEAYRKVWTAEGSPLVGAGRRVAAGLSRIAGLPVELAMRYGNPGVVSAAARLLASGAEEILVLPLFPHYAMASFESAAEHAVSAVRLWNPGIRISLLPPYYDHPDYIEALVETTREARDAANADHLLFSFHGIPERQIRKSDPTHRHCLSRPDCCEAGSVAHATCYRHQCRRTVNAFARKAALQPGRFSMSYQSRLGLDRWLAPHTDAELRRLAGAGVRRLAVICPSFTADCLETIEEIGIRGSRVFRKAGGREFIRLPCLNDHPAWLAALARMLPASRLPQTPVSMTDETREECETRPERIGPSVSSR